MKYSQEKEYFTELAGTQTNFVPLGMHSIMEKYFQNFTNL